MKSVNTVIDTLFINYTQSDKDMCGLEFEREIAFSNLDEIAHKYSDSDEITEAGISLQHAAMRAAFHSGFITAMQLCEGVFKQ